MSQTYICGRNSQNMNHFTNHSSYHVSCNINRSFSPKLFNSLLSSSFYPYLPISWDLFSISKHTHVFHVMRVLPAISLMSSCPDNEKSPSIPNERAAWVISRVYTNNLYLHGESRVKVETAVCIADNAAFTRHEAKFNSNNKRARGDQSSGVRNNCTRFCNQEVRAWIEFAPSTIG